jgi:hypothetical protein
MAREGKSPMRDESTEFDDAFGHWLAGFADGEGCFSILHHKGREAYHCQFIIGLRDDDTAILREVHARTGLGYLRRREVCPSSVKNARAQTYWVVHRKTDCLALVEIFDRYPLRAKKARDYAVWREAVLEWERWTGKRVGVRQRTCYVDWRRMAELRRQIQAVRQYPGTVEVVGDDPRMDYEGEMQMTLLGEPNQ